MRRNEFLFLKKKTFKNIDQYFQIYKYIIIKQTFFFLFFKQPFGQDKLKAIFTFYIIQNSLMFK